MRIGQCLGKDLIDYGKCLRDILLMISSGGNWRHNKDWERLAYLKRQSWICWGVCKPSKQDLSLSAKVCKIDKVPLSMLEVMFEKVASLIQAYGLVILKPGSSDGSYVVAGTCNRMFCVTPGKGGSFKCDCTCINSTIKNCEHVISVAEKCGKLPDFVQNRDWFSSEWCIKIGWKKPSNRKRSNKRKPEIESNVDLLVENDRSTPNFNFQSLGYYAVSFQDPHPTYAEAVQTDGIANGCFSQEPSKGQSLPNVPLYYNVTQ